LGYVNRKSDKEVLKLRERLGVSQDELARVLGLAGRHVVYRWEAGSRIPGETIRRLVCLLNDLSEREMRQWVGRLKSYGEEKK
jgi:DNA-binding transcriptional regulator YiaG